MLKTRIVPILTLFNGRMVKTRQFGAYRDVGDPMKAPMVYDAQLADELVYVDMRASVEGRGVDELARRIDRVAGECFMPLTAGGGIATLEHITTLLNAGADKVTINSAAVARPQLITEGAERFGNQCIVVSIDVRRVEGEPRVFTHSGTTDTGLGPVAWARRVESLGAGEILLTSIDRDGTMQGYDTDLVSSVTRAVSVPVIAAGGAGKLIDLVTVIIDAGADAAGAASLFHFTDQSPIKAKAFMRRHELVVR